MLVITVSAVVGVVTTNNGGGRKLAQRPEDYKYSSTRFYGNRNK
jgi:hypothetical protein